MYSRSIAIQHTFSIIWCRMEHKKKTSEENKTKWEKKMREVAKERQKKKANALMERVIFYGSWCVFCVVLLPWCDCTLTVSIKTEKNSGATSERKKKQKKKKKWMCDTESLELKECGNGERIAHYLFRNRERARTRILKCCAALCATWTLATSNVNN